VTQAALVPEGIDVASHSVPSVLDVAFKCTLRCCGPSAWIQLTNALNPGLGCLRLREAGRPDVEMLEDRLINWFGKNHGDDPQC